MELLRTGRLAVSARAAGAVLLALALACAAPARATTNSLTGVPHSPLEDRALSEPEAVLRELPERIAQARKRDRYDEQAMLFLAQANACRVVADWPCQRVAGAAASNAAQAAGKPLLVVRGYIAESRALIAMEDYSRGEELLGRAELLLKANPSPELSADVYLAYSSLSYALGKHALSGEYAARGLSVLKDGQALPTQVRLLRNLARSQTQLGQPKQADQTLQQARLLAERFDDPKLSAELLFGAARMAREAGDNAAQVRAGEQVLAMAGRLKNSQLGGMAHEVLGLAALDRGDEATSLAELRTSYRSFRELGLKRDELRVLRELLKLSIARGEPSGEMATRFLAIDAEIEASDRAKAADDFDARLKYAEREFELLRLRDEAALARLREAGLTERNRQAQWLTLATAGLLLVLGAFFLQQRRSHQQVKNTLSLLRESEARALDLLNLSAGFVFLHDLRGRLLLVNPATAQALGQPAEVLVGRSLADFQPRRSRADFDAYLARLQAEGQDEGVFLVRSFDGGHRHWRYSSRLSAPKDGRAHVVGNAVDVTDQVQEARVLHEQSVRDALTGSYNRRQLEVFENAHRFDGWGALSIDLDHFKQVNDSQGHDRGDQVLIEFCRFLSRRIEPQDAVVRLGGDEFALLLAGGEGRRLEALVERLRRDASLAPCEFSLGAAMRDGDEALTATLARADGQMYSVRAATRGVTPV
jgi:diguanylate cyclase (GGDEF)-like protein/PAS domain S-box-containing protein